MKKIEKGCFLVCSNGLEQKKEKTIKELQDFFQKEGIELRESPHLYRSEHSVQSEPAPKRAERCNAAFQEEKMDAVFDVSGGDLAIEVVPYLDYERIGTSEAVFWGYSDLTTVINAIYAKTGKSSILFQIRNLAGEKKNEQQLRFLDVQAGGNRLFDVSIERQSEKEMEGILVGGNIRCLLKLAGSEYFPDLQGKILFLECLHGKEPQLRSMFSQLKVMGAFEQVNGILLGTFSEMEEAGQGEMPEKWLMELTKDSLPIARTTEVGHGADSKALWIGKKIRVMEGKIRYFE